MIKYSNQKNISAKQLSDIFKNSGIHRPITDLTRLEKMLNHADVLWTAWDNKKLVGVARALTDFSYACYLSDLAVDLAYQKHGIGRNLIDHLQKQLGKDVSMVLLAAPNAMDYYPKVDFKPADNAFLVPRNPF